MPTIEVDFETYKAITAQRPNESVSEGDVVRSAMGLNKKEVSSGDTKSVAAATWVSEGVAFRVGEELQHRFRGGRIANAKITAIGVEYENEPYGGLSPAAAAAAGHQANGWQFWEVRRPDGRWVKADSRRAQP